MKYSVLRRSEKQGVVVMQDGKWTTQGFGADAPLGKTLIRRFTEQMVSKSEDGEPIIKVNGPALYKIGRELNVTFKPTYQ
jgi:hypothetical protein